MKRLALSLIFLTVFPLGIMAESKEDEEVYAAFEIQKKKEIEREIPKLVEQYATSIGCGFGMNPENVVKFTLNDSFVVLFSLDVGCSGGNKMYRPVFAVVQHGAYFTTFINSDYSNPNQTSQKFPQQTFSLYSQDGKIFYRAKQFRDSKEIIEGELRFEDNQWKGINSQLVQPN